MILQAKSVFVLATGISGRFGQQHSVKNYCCCAILTTFFGLKRSASKFPCRSNWIDKIKLNVQLDGHFLSQDEEEEEVIQVVASQDEDRDANKSAGLDGKSRKRSTLTTTTTSIHGTRMSRLDDLNKFHLNNIQDRQTDRKTRLMFYGYQQSCSI